LFAVKLKAGLKFTVATRGPEGVIRHTAAGAHPARGIAVPFLIVNSGLANVKVRLPNGPEVAGTLVVFRNAVSIWSLFTSISCGPVVASKSIFPGFSTAPKTVTSKEITSTFAGGVSFKERITLVPPSG
jgi:hypothetical protein